MTKHLNSYHKSNQMITNVRKGEELDSKKLSEYLTKVTERNFENPQIFQFSGGYSNLTYLIRSEDLQLVLRKPPKGANIKSGHDMSREFQVLSALYPEDIKVPQPLYFCDDHEVLGSDFYIMEYVDGLVLRADIPSDKFPEPSKMKELFDMFCTQFVHLHASDPKKFAFADKSDGSKTYPERQIYGWSSRYQNAKTDEVTPVEQLISWLSSHIPLPSGHSIIHNDYKYDNIILDEKTLHIKAILDWEMSTVGDPLMDLGSSLGYWVNIDDPEWLQNIKLSPTTIPGNPSREEFLHQYATASGKDPGNGVFYYAYGMLKLAVIAQQIYKRYVTGQTTNPKFAALKMVVEACGVMGMQAINRKKIDQLF